MDDETIEVDVNVGTVRSVRTDGKNIKIEIKPSPQVPNSNNVTNKFRSEDESKTKRRNKSEIVCRFFKIDGTCKQGNNCKFLHNAQNSMNPEENNPARYEKKTSYHENESSPEENADNDLVINSPISRVCKYFVTQKGCREGDNCPFKHYRSVSDAGDLMEDDNESACTKVTIKEEDLELECHTGVVRDVEKESEPDRIADSSQNDVHENNEIRKRENCQEKIRALGAAQFKKDKICKYYMTTEGCSESMCKYKHEVGDDVEITERNGNIKKEKDADSKSIDGHKLKTKKTKSEIVCRYSNSPKGCRHINCPYLHPESGSKSNTDKEKLTKNNEQVKRRSEELDNVRPRESIRKKVPDIEDEINAKAKQSNNETFCKYDNTTRGCTDKRCKFRHSEYNNNKKINIEEREKLSNNSSKNKRVDTSSKAVEGNSNTHAEERVCKFFVSRHGCFAKNCQFLHPQLQKSSKNVRKDFGEQTENNVEKKSDKRHIDVVKVKNDVDLANVRVIKESYQRDMNNVDGNVPERQTCKFYQQPRGCFSGTKCPFLHVNPHVAKTPKEIEFTQLEKRFGSKFTLLQNDPSRIYVVIVSPTDPDWVFIIKEFDLEIEFPVEYPKEMFKVKLIENEKFPPQFVEFFNESLSTWVENRSIARDVNDLAFRPFVKWFDRNLKETFTRAATLVKLQQDAQKAGITFVHHQNILPKKPDPLTTENELQEVNAEETELTAGDANDLIAMHSGSLTNGHDSKDIGLSEKVKKGTEMKFSNLVLSESIGTLKLRIVALTIECNRCRTRTDVNLQDKKLASATCKKCHSMVSVTYYSEFIHPFSPVVGYLHMEGCKAFDLILLNSTIIVNCLNCSKDDIIKGMAYGSKRNHWCHSCHKKIEITIQTSKFNQIGGSGGFLGKKNDEVVKKKSVKHPSIKDGEPLPDNGACKHYKKSYRWLRFPCCGKAYPCDICHEEKEENSHEMKFATRMICGYCSKEQPFLKDKPCIRCNAAMTRSKSTHWEGGKGCRNRDSMARGDNKKTAGLGKTISRKKVGDQDKNKK